MSHKNLEKKLEILLTVPYVWVCCAYVTNRAALGPLVLTTCLEWTCLILGGKGLLTQNQAALNRWLGVHAHSPILSEHLLSPFWMERNLFPSGKK